ncbi:uncharacterized protein LOC124940353 [Impatiens glandulifera]|uniref:uncharacterized protein LOC124940353 n=1 Tax=Impatiens glandulifera TaxID=253017 RepID=UPI001FB0A122|nr:uncharacterized protein LOC124940353 [Impatiens glandulifera]
MAATRLTQLGVSNHSSSSSCSCFNKSKLVPFATRTIRGDSRLNGVVGFSGAGGEIKEKQRPPPAAAAATERSIVVVSDEVKWGLSNLIDLLANVTNKGILVLKKMKMVVVKRRRKPIKKKFHVQMFLERGILDCRFFTMFAVAGSMLASFLCFLEGCFLMIESYVHNFNSLSHTIDHQIQGHVVHLLIEALDMFLMGTGMLVLAMGLHGMFVGSSGSSSSSPSWAGMKTVEEAKARIGHALMLMLQVGLIDKFNNIPLITGMDLAFFAAAVFLSSASVYLLSSLTIFRKQTLNPKL